MKEGLENWLNCKYGMTFGQMAGDEAGYELRIEGYNENYGCECPEIVNSGKFEISGLIERRSITSIAVLYSLGKVTDPKVLAALNETCAKCPYFNSGYKND